MKTRTIVAFTAVLVLLIFSLIFFLFPPNNIKKQPGKSYSTTETTPEGGKALYLLLDKLGFKTEQWTFPYSELKEENENCSCAHDVKCLFVNEPEYPPEPEEIEELLSWVKTGGILIWGVKERDLLIKTLEIKQSTVNFGQVTLTDFPKHTIFQNVKQLKIEREYLLETNRLESEHKITPLITEKQKYVFMEVSYGKGTIYLHTSPLLFSNRDLPLGDNAAFAVNLMEYISKINPKHPQTIWFDEYHNGFVSGQNIFNVMPLWLKLVLLQCIIILLVLFLYHAKRFGSPFPLPEPPRRSILEYISSTANLYRRAEARLSILRLLYTGFKHKICNFTGLALDTPTYQLISNLKSGKKFKEKEFESFLIRCDGYLQKGRLTEQELLSLSKELEKWRKELITR